jgi:hypothetical protein
LTTQLGAGAIGGLRTKTIIKPNNHTVAADL